MTYIRWLFLILIYFFAFCGLQAKDTKKASVWMVIMGKQESLIYWTCTKLATLDSDDDGKYDGMGLIMKVIEGILGDAIVVMETRGHLANTNISVTVDTTKPFPQSKVLQECMSQIFLNSKGKPVSGIISLSLPFEPWVIAKKDSPFFVDKPIIISVNAPEVEVQKPSISLWMALSKQLQANYYEVDPSLASFKEQHKLPSTIQGIEMIWQGMLADLIPDSTVLYNDKLGVVFIKIPSKDDEGFFQICESMLSGNRKMNPRANQ